MSLFLLFEEQLKNVSVKNYHVIREGVERGQKENPLQSINRSQNEAGIHMIAKTQVILHLYFCLFTYHGG